MYDNSTPAPDSRAPRRTYRTSSMPDDNDSRQVESLLNKTLGCVQDHVTLHGN